MRTGDVAMADQQHQDSKNQAREQDAMQILKELPHFSTPETLEKTIRVDVAAFYRMR
jgi:hypothetical protein